ncbi:hypothetical protein [Desulfosporosinus sp. BICA1-9]|uniref:hypothetical protein n=1 Tax=Desulfosporosinus sp. BICA1-9 TaxID=1531958 RepID=UPI0025C56E50|nr:hypothetical protein [Desulfosporosinus sp. BICA1-9]
MFDPKINLDLDHLDDKTISNIYDDSVFARDWDTVSDIEDYVRDNDKWDILNDD